MTGRQIRNCSMIYRGFMRNNLTTLKRKVSCSCFPFIRTIMAHILLPSDNFCPICFVPYLTILTEEEMASAMDSPAHPIEELGVTKLSQSCQCGHMFCRRDISKWITSGHASCPMCRRHLVEEATSDRELTAEERAHDEEREEEYRRASAFVISQMSQVQQQMHSARAGSIPEDTIQAFDSNLGLLREAGIPAPRTPSVEDYRREYSGCIRSGNLPLFVALNFLEGHVSCLLESLIYR
ncbi:hypothetical protein BDZ97DRAFT_11692 [Flammula alnicola]|nr:hypothetical protein BDZ97DRAFT_11692 [Flammula alnicola]